MALILLLAVLGLLVGGIRGLLIGALLGLAIRFLVRKLLAAGAGALQEQFIDSAFSVMGALSKADRVVTRNEIRAAEQLFEQMRLTAEQRERAKAAFNRGKAPDFDLDVEVGRLARAARGRVLLLQMFLQVQLMAVAADGNVHDEEHRMLVRVARGLGMSEHDVAQLEALLRAAAAGASGAAAQPTQRLEDAYAALGLSSDASEKEIKRAYRRLVSENHPDKLAGRGLPESMRRIAEEKTRELNAAYDLIKEARGFV